MMGIPVIDMKNERNFAEKIVKALSEWGCFRMINHGVPMKLMSEMKALTRALTDLPMEMKLTNSDPHEPSRGYIPPNSVNLIFESLSLHDMTSPGVFDNFCSQMEVSPHQRQVLKEYKFAVHDLAQLLGRKVMEGLGMEGDLFKNWPCQLRMNKYNYAPETVGTTGAVLHADPGFLTILQDDEMVNGLETMDKITGELVPRDPIPGSLVVIVGDVATAWSNGRFYNVKHRVVCHEATIRNSIALFVLAPRDEKVEAPPQLVDSEHPRLYVPFHFEDYRKLRSELRTGAGLQYFLTKTSSE